MNSTRQALKREAGIAASHLGIGVTALGKANYAQDAYYSQAFFALSIGFERTAKLILLVDYALDHNGDFPTNETLKEYGHKLKELLIQSDKIAKKRHFEEQIGELPNTDIHKSIIEILSSFASNVTRYYNLDFVTGVTANKNTQDPIKAWYEHVILPILDIHYKPQQQAKHEQNARIIADFMEPITLVRFHSEQGQPLNSVFDSSLQTAKIGFAMPYSRMYVMQIIRFLANLLFELTHLTIRDRLEDIPYFPEFFAIFNNEDRYFKRRKTWLIDSPYH
ncbi:hypothetical protein [Aggregatilinea lenta]|uniref:hypothetical protein n=1 Tax=Aggregatilinea lenta TaxID=913108 RepID=UPI0013C2ACEB|nr:hypothetical protein [Aggregatilinea lenta]